MEQTQIELSSPKLIELKAAVQTAYTEMLKHTDYLAIETKNAKLALYKAESDMNAEIAALNKAANDAKIAEARNQRLALVSNLLAAHLAFKTAPKTSKPEQLAELETAFNTANEAVQNELLAKYATSKPASSTNGDGGKSSANTDAVCWPLFAAGKSNKEVETETGIPRSTVWFSSDRYKKANQIAK